MSNHDDDTGRAGMQGMEGLFRGRPGDKGDKGDPGITTGARRAVFYLLILTLLLAAAAVLVGAREVSALHLQIRAECRFNGDLGKAPITLNPATRKPSILGVSIVSDARVAWHQLGCPGTIPAPDPSFTRWAKAYNLPYK